jgi:O-antigen ligase
MESATAVVGFFVGSIVFILSSKFENFYKVMAGGLFTYFLLFPVVIYMYMFYFLDMLPYDFIYSWDHRIYIAFNTIFLSIEKLFFGWGFGISKELYSSIDQGAIYMAEIGGHPHAIFNYHPHNSSLQVLLELGVVGLVLFSLAWLATIIKIGSSRVIPFKMKSGILAMIASYIAMGQLNFSMWNSWWLCLILLSITTISVIALHKQS